jgi:hypothetical protein
VDVPEFGDMMFLEIHNIYFFINITFMIFFEKGSIAPTSASIDTHNLINAFIQLFRKFVIAINNNM